MKKYILSTIEKNGEQPLGQKMSLNAACPLMTSLGILEGDLLAYIDKKGKATLSELVRYERQEWPVLMVVMGVGALIRQGLVRSRRRGEKVVLSSSEGCLMQRNNRIAP